MTKNCQLPDPNDPRHGKYVSYVHCRCRCDRCKAANAEYLRGLRKRNPDKFLAYERERAKKPERQAQRREHTKRTSEYKNAKSRQFRKENPEVGRAASSRRRARQAKNLTKQDIAISVGYRKAIASDRCFYCTGPGQQDDHYFPVSKGGTDVWYNLVRSCQPCNNTKSAHCGTWFILRRGLEISTSR